jgi:hypothetical protein
VITVVRLIVGRGPYDDNPLVLDGPRVDLTDRRGETDVLKMDTVVTVFLGDLTTDQLLNLAKFTLELVPNRVPHEIRDPRPS